MSEENLAEMLAELKDTSETIVDLAYSALLCGSEEIANHVIEMEERMDKLHTDFELAVLRLKETRPAKGLLGLIRLSIAAEDIADAANTMALIVKKGVRAHPVVWMAFERAEETIVTTVIAEESPLVGRSLGELGLEDDIGMRAIAVRRAGRWTYSPQDSFVLERGDLLVARGYVEGRERLLALANPTQEE